MVAKLKIEHLQAKLYLKSYLDEKSIVNFIHQLLVSYNIKNQIRLLDIGCGPGRLFSEYNSYGWDITCLEPDIEYYSFACKQAELYSNIGVNLGGFNDIRQFHNCKFNIVVSINDPLSYIYTVEERVTAIRNIYALLEVGGIFFVEVPNFVWILRNYVSPTNEVFMVDDYKVNRQISHDFDYHNHIWIHKDIYTIEDEVIEKLHPMALLTPLELIYFFREAGFQEIRTHCDYTKVENQPINSKLILLSGRK